MAKYLIKRGSIYSVRYVIPKKWREILGRSSIVVSTGTGDLREAERKRNRILADLHDQCERDAAAAPKSPRAPHDPRRILDAAADLYRQVEAGTLDAESASDILGSLMREQAELSGGPNAGPQIGSKPIYAAARRTLTSGAAIPDTLSAAKDAFLESQKARGIAPKTVDRQSNIIDKFIQYNGDAFISDVGREHTGRWFEQVLMRSTHSRKNKRIYLSALSTFFDWAERRGKYSGTNPWAGFARDLKPTSADERDDAKQLPWTPEQLLKLAQLKERHPAGYLVGLIMLYTGFRCEEICQLKVTDVDLEHGLLKVRAGKNKNAVREQVIHRELLPTIRRLVDTATEEWLVPGIGTRKSTGKRYPTIEGSLSRWVKANIDASAKVTFYGLKHTFVTALERAGIDSLMMMRLKGETPRSITLSVYSAGPELDAMRTAINRISFKTE